MSTLAVATWLVEARGLSVIPADHPSATTETDPKRIGKVPALVRWKPYQTRKPTRAELRQWFANGVPHNVAIITGAVSGVVVVDPDDDEAEAWAAAQLPATPMMCRTSRQTHHRYYKHPGAPVSNKARIETADRHLRLDIRGDGGYVIGPTSQHASGAIYTRIGEWPPVADLPVFDPAWLGTAPRGRPPALTADRLRARGAAYLAALGPAIEGDGGNARTYRAACFLVRDLGLDDATALALLEDWNARNVPPWTVAELDARIRHAHAYGKHAFGTALDEPPPRSTTEPHASAGDAPPPPPAATTAPLVRYPHTDLGNAEYFAARVSETLCYDYQQQAWRQWIGPHWALDTDGLVSRLAKSAMRQRRIEAGQLPAEEQAAAVRWAIGSESRARLDATVALAKSESPLAHAGNEWDADPWQLACRNGVVDLRSGVLRSGRRTDWLTHQTGIAFEPEADCPRWRQFLADVFGGDEALIEFVQLAAGYSLTGCTDEQALFVCYGSGSNGKTTLLETLKAVLGSYAHSTPFSTLEYDTRNHVPADLAALAGKRFVLAAETHDAARLNEARVKLLTGSDTVTARFLFRNLFEFRPVCKLWLAVNHRPAVHDTSHGFWRRVRLVPFLQRFTLNKRLGPALKAEAAGILRWAVTGAIAWCSVGLSTPPQVLAATDEYQEDSDTLADFIRDCITVDPPAVVTFRDVHEAYRRWATKNGIEERSREHLSRKTLGHRLGERYARTHIGPERRRAYQGIALVPDHA